MTDKAHPTHRIEPGAWRCAACMTLLGGLAIGLRCDAYTPPDPAPLSEGDQTQNASTGEAAAYLLGFGP